MQKSGRGRNARVNRKMQVDFLTSFLSVAVMVALAIPGFILRKTKILGDTAVATLVAVLFYVAQPMLTVSSFLEKDYEPRLLVGMGVTLAVSIAAELAVFAIAFFLFGRGRGEGEKGGARRVAIICSYLGNVGFMGIPVIKALFPAAPEMLIYTAVFNVGFNLTAFTVGIFTITGEKKYISPKKAILNPPTIALAAALPLFFAKRYIVPSVLVPLSNAIGYVSGMTLPLSMMILGVRLCDFGFRPLVKDGRPYIVSAMKLVVAPLVTMGLCALLRLAFPAIDRAVLVTCFIAMSMPCASLTLMLSELYDSHRPTAVRSLLISTILSVITIPLLMLLTPFI